MTYHLLLELGFKPKISITHVPKLKTYRRIENLLLFWSWLKMSRTRANNYYFQLRTAYNDSNFI